MPVPFAAPATTHGAVVPIAYYTANGSTSCTFSNIPQIYQDLRIVIYGRANAGAGDSLAMYFNAFGSANHSETRLYGDGSSAASSRQNGAGYWGNMMAIANSSLASGIYSAFTFDILNYKSTTTFKTMIGRSASDFNGSGTTYLNACLYAGTSAITSISIFPTSGAQTFASGSTAALYGIRSVNQ